MRFIRKELSPANKPQYLLALGRKDIELLIGEAVNAARYTPSTQEQKDNKRRLRSIAAALGEALDVAKADNDEGARVAPEDRAKYKADIDKNPMLDITRMEIIDHRNTEMPSATRRETIFWDKSVELTSSVQDNGRTLKLFLNDRSKEDIERIERENVQQFYSLTHQGDPADFIRKFMELING